MQAKQFLPQKQFILQKTTFQNQCTYALAYKALQMYLLPLHVLYGQHILLTPPYLPMYCLT